MQTNVFLRSTRRQPVRTAFLALVLALVSFTFVGRGSEYLLISQEVDRLGSWYRDDDAPRDRGKHLRGPGGTPPAPAEGKGEADHFPQTGV